MNTDQMMAALNALCNELGGCSIRMRKPGEWYLDSGRLDIVGGGVVTSLRGEGATPQAAIESAWATVCNLPSTHALTNNSFSDARKEYRWNGFMWAEQERKAVAK